MNEKESDELEGAEADWRIVFDDVRQRMEHLSCRIDQVAATPASDVRRTLNSEEKPADVRQESHEEMPELYWKASRFLVNPLEMIASIIGETYAEASLHDRFMSSRLTEDVREQLSSRVALHYMLSELSPAEAKALIEKILKEEATEQNIGLVYKLTGGRFRNLEFFQPRYVELRELNKEQLKHGEVQTGEIIKMAAARLIFG